MTRPLTPLVALVAAALVLLGCAPGSAPPAEPPGAVARRVWLPEQPPAAVILAVHGFNDYSNAFEGFAAHAAAAGVAVHAYDQRGFGANPNAGRWPGIATLIGDFRAESDRLKALYPDRPLYLLGESMGAAVIIAAAAAGEPLDVAGTIITAPAVWGGDQLNPLYRAALWLAVHVAPGWKLSGRALDILPSDNLEMLRALSADPLVIKETRIDAIAGLVGLMDLAFQRADVLPGPLLVLGGVRDEIVPPKAHVAMLERLTAAPCTEATYPEGYHMLLRDLQRQLVWDDILAWLAGAPLPSGLARPCGPVVTSAVSGRSRS